MEYSHSRSKEAAASEFAPPEPLRSSQLWFGGDFPNDIIATDAPLGGGAILDDWPTMLWDSTLSSYNSPEIPPPSNTIDYRITPWNLLDPFTFLPSSGDTTSFLPTPSATSATSSASSAPDSPFTPFYPLSLPSTTSGDGYDTVGMTRSSSAVTLDVPFDFNAFDPQCRPLPGASTASALDHFQCEDNHSVRLASVHPVAEASQGQFFYDQHSSLHDWSFISSCYGNGKLPVPPVHAGSAGRSVIDLTRDSGDEGGQLHIAAQEALQAARRMPPRTLELRVISAADITRLTAAERRAIYICSLETHAALLESMALGTSAHSCNRDRIAELKDVDTKAAKSTVIQMHCQIQKLRDRRAALKARNAVLQADALSREIPLPGPEHSSW